VSATELIEQVKRELQGLPVNEQERFFNGVAALEQSLPSPRLPASGGTPLAWPDVQARHRRIFGDQVLPVNIVLAARDEEPH
jgi:hypothetical protein